MKKIIFALVGMFVALTASASAYNFKFNNVKLTAALNQIIELHPDLDINFIFNELDNYTVTATIATDDPYEALRRVVGLNPVSVVRKSNRFYLEALQHGKFAYSGTVVASDNESLPGVAVLLLSPRDSTVITYGTTDTEGRFNIPCDAPQVIAKLSCVGYMPQYVQSRDFRFGTIRMNESPVLLKGMEVEADLVTHYTDKTVYLPTSRQKTSSADGLDLLRRMAINQLVINPVSKELTTNNGLDVALYINRQPATDEDIKGMRVTDVRRVEFLEFPSDAVYKGAPYVVNFIVQEYEYGGYTKISDTFFFVPEISDKPDIYSKFSYRKMTYDLYVGFDEVNSSNVYANEDAEYRLNDRTVSRDFTTTRSRFKYIQLPVSFRAYYSSEKAKISNTVGYTFHDRYHDIRSGQLSIMPDAGNDYSYTTVAPFVNRSFFWKGGYDLYLPRQWNLYIEPTATYGHNSSYSNYTTDIPGDDPIRSDAKENVLYTRMDISAEKKLSDKHSISAIVHGGYTRNKIDYSGNSGYRSKFDHSFYSIAARYRLMLKKFNLNTDGGLIQEFTKTNVTDFNDPYPFLHLSATFNPNQKNSLTLWFQYAANSPEIENLSPNVIQSNEFIYITGNPDLRASRHTTVSLQYSCSPSNKFTLSAYGAYYIDHNRMTCVFEPYLNGNAIIRTYLNNGDFSRTQAGINATLRLLDSNLIIQGTGTLDAYKSTGIYNLSKTPLKGTLYAAYYLGNFSFSAYYQTRIKGLSSLSPNYSGTRSYYSISVSWSNSDWNAQFMLMNFARKSYNYGWNEMVTPLVTTNVYGFNSNYRCSAAISVAYTFGYGKKLNRGNEVGSQGISSSAILR